MSLFKNIVIVIIFTLNGFVFSQDTRIFDNTWYLHNLIVDGVTYSPPVNIEIPFISATFNKPDILETGMCESAMNGQLVYLGSTEFYFLSLAILTGGCYENKPINEDFNYLYQTFFFNTSEQDIYDYIISENGSNKTLTIINTNGDEAIYGNELLASPEFTNQIFDLFPNPSNEIVTIRTEDLKSITIFSSLGTQCFFKKFDGDSDVIIDVSNFTNGVYSILVLANNQQLVKKLIIK